MSAVYEFKIRAAEKPDRMLTLKIVIVVNMLQNISRRDNFKYIQIYVLVYRTDKRCFMTGNISYFSK